jgi:hypothetical protein
MFGFFCFSFLYSPAKNRTSSPSSASLQQPTNIGSNKISVSSSNFKRETSPTVCCYNTNSRSQPFRKSEQSEENFDTFAVAHRAEKQAKSSASIYSSNLANIHQNRSQNHHQKSFLATPSPSSNCGKSLIQNRYGENNFGAEKSFSYLKDKIRKFENPPNNFHENIINRSTTTRAEEESTADVDHPVSKSVSENDHRRINEDDDKNSHSFSGRFLINRDESLSRRVASVAAGSKRCMNNVNNKKLISDSNNNNQVKNQNQNLCESDTATIDSSRSSLTARQLLRDKNTSCCVNGGGGNNNNIKVTKVVIRHLSPIVNRKSHENGQIGVEQHKQSNIFDDNDFSFIDSSSRSVSRSSSTSVASDDFDEKVNARKFRIPKVARINNSNYSQEFSVKTCANQNIYSLDQSKNYSAQNACNVTSNRPRTYLSSDLEKSKNGQQLKVSTTSFPKPIIDQSTPENSVSFSQVLCFFSHSFDNRVKSGK